MRAHNTNLLQVQLTEAEKRHIKTLAASQGLTLRQATLQAFQAWAEQLQSRPLPADPARGTRAGADLRKPGRPKSVATPRQDRRQTEGALSPASGGGQIPKVGAATRAALLKATQLDWSKCPVAQRVPGKAGDVWVVRGTDAPLADVLQSVADGHPFLEIAEVFEITLQQLIAIVQFAAESAAPASAGR
jgi:uncharacterized protein (DUF433 family)